MTLIGYVSRKLETSKDLVRKMSKKSRFRRPFVKQHGKRSKTLLEIFRTAPLSYLLITVKKIELEEVCLSDMENLRTVS